MFSNRPLGLFGRLVLWVLGWKVRGDLPKQKKLVLILVPHTSSWDFAIAIATRWALDLDARWIGKKELFQGPLGPIMRWMGGVPVDRSRAEHVVDEVVKRFEGSESFWLGISPEGTRSYTERWKTGFYRLALRAKVPLWCASLDAKNRCLDLGIVIDLTGDEATDMARIQSYYSDVTAIHPERFGPVRLRLPEKSSDSG